MTSRARQISHNPWLDIPLSDYERHMNASSVAQASMLSDTLRELVEAYRPRSLALLGAAGGNGLDRVDPSVTQRVVTVDINAEYLDACRTRYCERFASFEQVHCDLSSGLPFTNPVELVYAGLILEFLEVDVFLDYAASLVTESGRIAFVFQEANREQGAVTNSGVASLQSLKSTHATVDVAKVIDALLARGMTVEERRGMVTTAGKSFTLLTMKKCQRLL